MTVALVALAALGFPAAASASCIRQSPQEQRDAAAVIFVGVALEGPTASGAQRFRVERYEKGGGADVRLVSTGVVAHADGTGSTSSVSVDAAAGERWRIYATPGAGGPLDTNVCAGSTRLATGLATGAGSDATPPPAGGSAAQGAPGDGDRLGLIVTALVLLPMLAAALIVARSRRHSGKPATDA